MIKTTKKPFLKWVGGKTQLLNEIEKRIPTNKEVYIEPFIGGGSVLLHILSLKNLSFKKFIVSDINAHLINLYNVVKTNVNELIKVLDWLKFKYESLSKTDQKQFYEDIRYQFNNGSSLLNQVAFFIFINKTCFNGMCRYNSKGHFNVPFGKHTKFVYDKENLIMVSIALEKVEIRHQDIFSYKHLYLNDCFLYLDPPYAPVSSTSNFTSYTKDKFDLNDQRILSLFCKTLDKSSKFLLSNSDSQLIRDLYNDFIIEEVEAKRSINSNGQKRGKIKELLIRNYKENGVETI